MDPAERVPLGRTRLDVTRLGLGLAPIGGLYAPVSDDDAARTVARGLHHGLRLFDTAPLYGHGLSERRTGAVLAQTKRDDFVLSTKVGRLLTEGDDGAQPIWAGLEPGIVPRFDFSYDGVMRSFEQSLARLGLDRIDILHIHDPDDHFDEAIEGACRALTELRSSNVIGAIGVGMNQADMLVRFANAGDFDCFLLAGRYTLLDRSALDELLPLCAQRGIAVIAAGVFQSGLLADPRPGATDNYSPVAAGRLVKALELQTICIEYGVPLRAAAIQFGFTHPAITSVIVGVRSAAEVDDAVAMMAHPIPAELWERLT
ncbi:aldo/keto reductase [Allorhizocola rhizosphaerae]|uniref:aldo/keto reductase n=1 Tax=Allorhizocola rhizosphaerae TaxID=1872709 RepID=UPI000E3C4A9E|nr:aldo/keto reductase [Allorhizocola rhizosphaerae]